MKSNAFKDQNYLYMDEMPEEKPSKIAKFKSFKVYPQSIEDAVDMMNMLDHDFYVFINKENNRLQIVYKRHDDDIGVLEPVE